MPKPVAARLDPFQNIVNVSGGVYVLIRWDWADRGTTNLGERCVQSGCDTGPVTNVFIACVQAVYLSAANLAIDYVDDELPGALINTPEKITHPTTALGYSTYRDCVQCVGGYIPQELYPCSDIHSDIDCNERCPNEPLPPINFPDEVFADPVPYNGYAKSFLLSIAPSAEDNTIDPLTVSFDIGGLPNPKPWISFVRTLPFCPAFFQGSNLTF